MTEVPHVYTAISLVQKALCEEGISKARKNQSQGYAFRGIDDVYNALSPILANNGLCILPRMLTRSLVEHASKGGGTLFYVTVEAEFDLVSAKDGSKHVIRTFGEAMDSGDKATNKAMSAAYKYACMQAFAIPTEGDNDADNKTHQVATKVATLTGEVKTAKPKATPEEAKRGGEMRAMFMRIGGEGYTSSVFKKMAYDTPADMIKVLEATLRNWSIDQQLEATKHAEWFDEAQATATLNQEAARWNWAVPSDVLDAMEALKAKCG
jgi:hypothetical protein